MKAARMGIGLAAWLLAASAFADAYPTRPVSVIVAFPPGGSSDVIGRVVAQALSKQFNGSFVVENKAGFGGNVGVSFAARAPKDGYTLLMCAVTAASISVTLTADRNNYDLEKDFAPISMLGKAPLALAVNAGVPATSLAQFIALAKSRPGQVTFSSAGIGTTQHLGGEVFQLMTGTKLLHIPYKGSGPSMTDLVGGQVQSTFETGPALAPFVNSDKLRILAYANESRSALFPNVPTAAEAGLPGFNVAATYGLLAPVGTPQAIVDQLNAAVKAVLERPEVKAALAQQGVETTYTTPAQTAAQIHVEIAKWGKVIKDANVKAE